MFTVDKVTDARRTAGRDWNSGKSCGGSMFEWSLKQSGVFWWLLFLTIQQVERVFLLPEVMAVEVPSTGVFVKTLTTGFRADLITSSIALLVVSVPTGMGGRYGGHGRGGDVGRGRE
jgi:hypothetical protein